MRRFWRRLGRTLVIPVRVAVFFARLLAAGVVALARATPSLWRSAVGVARYEPRRAIYTATAAALVILLPILYPLLTPPDPTREASLDCLALNMYHEARGEPVPAQIAVAKVVVNRVKSERFPDTVCDVVKQGGETRDKCQFSWWCDGRIDSVTDIKTFASIRGLAGEVLAGGYDDPTEGSLWYHAKSVTPAWRGDFEQGPTIGNHIFYQPRQAVK